MKNIKYRVWDKEYNVYSEEPFYRILIANNGEVYNSENDKWYEPNERYVIEFFTGLKDKNGKEIYEGDILNMKLYDEWTTTVRDYFGTLVVDVRGDDYNTTALSFVDDETEIEVIGNIYENPELLKTN